MSFSAKVILDSVSPFHRRQPDSGWTYPRIILAEIDTHRVFSRNSASSRAIPFAKQVEQARADPFIPDRFPINGPGMQPCAYVCDDPENLLIVIDEEAWMQIRAKRLAAGKPGVTHTPN